MDGGSAGAAGSGSSKNLEGLHIGMFLVTQSEGAINRSYF